MDESPRRRTLPVVVALLIGGAILSSTVFLGGQTSIVLSTVGGPIGNPSGGGSGDGTGGDTTGTGSGSGSDPAVGSANGGQVADGAAAVPTLRIVRTGELEMTVADLGAALRDGDGAVIRAGGYVAGSSRVTASGSESAQVTYRIPSSTWESTLGALRGLASTVVKDQVETEEVSGQVVDLAARIANLRATEAALQAIMAKATKIGDVLSVQDQLTSTRGDIEKLVADKEHLTDRAAYGSLAVTYRLPVVPAPTATPVPAKGWDPGDDVAQASGKLVRIGQTTTSIGIWLTIVGLPLAIGGLLVLLAAWQVVRLGRWLVRRREAALQPGA